MNCEVVDKPEEPRSTRQGYAEWFNKELSRHHPATPQGAAGNDLPEESSQDDLLTLAEFAAMVMVAEDMKTRYMYNLDTFHRLLPQGPDVEGVAYREVLEAEKARRDAAAEKKRRKDYQQNKDYQGKQYYQPKEADRYQS